MRITLVNQFFWPDLAPTSVLLTDFTRHLTARGHDVTVLCGAATYAGADCTTRPNVRIVRVPTLSVGPGACARVSSYGSFLATALWRVLRMQDPDVIITMTTPPLISLIGGLLRRFKGVRHYVWEMDLYPDVAVDLGMLLPGSLAARLLGRIADWGRANSDLIIAIGNCMKARLLARNVPESKIVIAENWSDSELFSPSVRSTDGASLTLAYTGHLGLGHDVTTIANAMASLKSDQRFQFVFIGGGQEMQWLQTFCEREQLSHVTFLPYANRAKLNALMSNVDVGLVTQKCSCVGSIVPSKFYSLAALGLPILYIGAPHATPAELIQRFNCGWTVLPGESQQLVRLLLDLARSKESVRIAGQAALNAFRNNWDRPIAVRHLATMIGLDSADAPA